MSQRIIKSSILVFLVSACTLGVEENVKQDLAFFPIEEAELVYNQTIAPTRSFSSRKSARISMLYCGDFTADWTRAESSSDSEVSAYSVPVNSEYRLYSYKKNKEYVVKRPWRRIQQDLYVYKKYNGATGAAIRSIIKRHGLKKTEKFSGVVAYSDLNTGNIQLLPLLSPALSVFSINTYNFEI